MKGLEWRTDHIPLDAKAVIQTMLQQGRTESSSFLCTREVHSSTVTIPKVPASREYNIEIDEIDF